MNREIKLWAVIWTDKGMEEYGVPKDEFFISVEPKEDILVNVSKSKIGRPRYLYADALAIFQEKKQAEAFKEGNTDWKIISIKITRPWQAGGRR